MLNLTDLARKTALDNLGAAVIAVCASPVLGQSQSPGTQPPAYNSVPATPSAVPPLHGGGVQGAYTRGFPHPPPGSAQPGSSTANPPVVIDPYSVPPSTPLSVDQNGYAYFCPALGAYYPDTTQCPGPWQLVPSQ